MFVKWKDPSVTFIVLLLENVLEKWGYEYKNILFPGIKILQQYFSSNDNERL